MAMVDKSEIMYDAYKETYYQAKTLYKVNILIGMFALLVIILVVRDILILKGAEPKIENFNTQIQLIETELSQVDEAKFTSPKGYFATKKQFAQDQSKLANWHENKPGRKNMKNKYEKLLKEYSGSHDKVLERLKVDGEPGMDLFKSLKDTFIAFENTRTKLDKLEAKRSYERREFSSEQALSKNRLEKKRETLKQEIKNLQDEMTRIQYDETRLPWLGLRVNPKDITPLLPFILMIFFHILFYKFEELMAITTNPVLKEFKDELSKYPLPIFLGRRNLYAIITIVFMFGLVPLAQAASVTLTWQHQISLLSLGQESWLWLAGTGTIATLITISYPAMIIKRYRKQILND